MLLTYYAFISYNVQPMISIPTLYNIHLEDRWTYIFYSSYACLCSCHCILCLFDQIRKSIYSRTLLFLACKILYIYILCWCWYCGNFLSVALFSICILTVTDDLLVNIRKLTCNRKWEKFWNDFTFACFIEN